MRRVGSWVRQHAVAAFALLVVFALASTLARAGSTYTYCTMTGVVGEAPCCAHDAHDDGAMPSAHATEVDCCKRMTAPSLPSADSPAPRVDAPRTPLLATLPSAAVLAALVRFAEPRRTSRTYEHPPDARSRAEARAQLMVFLT